MLYYINIFILVVLTFWKYNNKIFILLIRGDKLVSPNVFKGYLFIYFIFYFYYLNKLPWPILRYYTTISRYVHLLIQGDAQYLYTYYTHYIISNSSIFDRQRVCRVSRWRDFKTTIFQKVFVPQHILRLDDLTV